MAFIQTTLQSLNGVDYASARSVVLNEQCIIATFPAVSGVYSATLDIVGAIVTIESTDSYWSSVPTSFDSMVGRVDLDVLELNGRTYEVAKTFSLSNIIWAFEGSDGYARMRYRNRTKNSNEEYKVDLSLANLLTALNAALSGSASFPVGATISGAIDMGIFYTNGTTLSQSSNLLWDYNNDQLVIASYGSLSITGTATSLAAFTTDGEMIELDPADYENTDDLDDVMGRGTTLSANYVISTANHHYTIDSGTAEIRLYGTTRVDSGASVNFYVGTASRNNMTFNKPDTSGGGPPSETGMMFQFSDGGLYSDPDLGRTMLIISEYSVSSLFLGIEGTEAVIGPQNTSDFYLRRNLDYGSSDILGSGTDVLHVSRTDGQVTWSEYDSSSTLTGAVTGYLGVNDSGEMQRVPAGSVGGGGGDIRDSLMLMGG